MRSSLGVILMVSLADCANILAVLPIAVKSHYILMEPLLQALTTRGHHLTVFSCFPKENPPENYTDIDCAKGRSIYFNNFSFKDMESVMHNAFETVHHLFDTVDKDCEFVYSTSKLDSIKDKKFDLMIAEMFAGDCFVHIAHKLGIPLVSIATNVPMPWTSDKFGLPDNPSYIPNSLSRFTPDMSFWQRIVNTVVLAYGKVLFTILSNPKSQRFAEEYFQERLPWVEDLARNSSLLLVNNHFSLSHSRPIPPNVVEIGGIHIKDAQPLPKDIQDILDSSPQGAILFTFGSMLRISTFPKEKIKMMLNVFEKLPQTILMKYEEDLPDAPKNVIVRNWLPQRDILGHKNLVAFVTHAGLASVMESVYNAKPIVGVPFFSDQFLNTNNLAWKSAGVGIDFYSMTQQDFEHAVDQVLNNPKIKEGMRRLSEQFRDRPMTALQSAVYWTEYVLRHKGAPHLRPASTSLPFYQLWLLDVITVLLAVVAAASLVIYWSVTYIIQWTLALIKVNSNDKTNKID